jgi:hypothetical protein
MRRLIVIFGIALMVFAFVILTLFIIAPSVVSSLDDAPLLKSILQIAVCGSNEVLTANYSTYDTPASSTRSVYLNCVDREQNARDVSQQTIQIGMIGYLGPFLIGLFMARLGRPGNKRQTKVLSSAAGINFADREADTLEGLLKTSKEARGRVTILNPSGQVHSQMHNQPDHLPLAQRLRELKEAYSAGLLTEAEYQAKRKELLDES